MGSTQFRQIISSFKINNQLVLLKLIIDIFETYFTSFFAQRIPGKMHLLRTTSTGRLKLDTSRILGSSTSP